MFYLFIFLHTFFSVFQVFVIIKGIFNIDLYCLVFYLLLIFLSLLLLFLLLRFLLVSYCYLLLLLSVSVVIAKYYYDVKIKTINIVIFMDLTLYVSRIDYKIKSYELIFLDESLVKFVFCCITLLSVVLS